VDEINIFPCNFSIHDGNLTGADGNQKITNFVTATSKVHFSVGLPRFLDAAALAL
jgi:hypothetical protein